LTADQATIENLSNALRRRFGQGARVENVRAPSVGASSSTLIFELVDGASRRMLVSRTETYTDRNSPFLSASDQFALVFEVFRSGFPVPEPVFQYDPDDEMGDGYVSVFVEGVTLPKTIVHSPAFAGARSLFAVQCAELLATLHRLSPSNFPYLGERSDSIDPIAAQRDRYMGYGVPRPAIDLGLRWLEKNHPPVSRKSLLHGDFRVGNLMVSERGIIAVLDWECSHLGSPSEDIGWLCNRAWRFGNPGMPVGGIDKAGPLLAAYERFTGTHVDDDEIRYWTIFGLVRWAILNVMQAKGHLEGNRRGLVYAACGRNTSLIEYDILMSLKGVYL